MDLKEFNEVKDLVTKIMDENKIDYNRNFARMGSAGYPNDDCQALAEECLALMADYCKKGVNGGFSRSMEDSLEALSDICAQMSDRRKDRDADKRREACEKKKAEIVRDIKLTKIEEAPIKELVFKYIDRSLMAIPALIRKNPSQEEILQSSEKQLILLRTSIEKAVDGTSKIAYDRAKSIIDYIKAWRASAKTICTKDALKQLQEAVDVAHDWNKLLKPVKNSERAYTEEYVYKLDDIDKIALSSDVKEKMDSLKTRISTARGSLSARYDTSELVERQNSLKSEIDRLNAQVQEDKERYANGSISKDQLLMGYKRIKVQLAKLNADCAHIENQISMKNQNRLNQDATFASIENLLREISSYENEPAAYYVIGNRVPFDSVDAIISGFASEEQVKKFISALQLNLEFAKKIATTTTAVTMGEDDILQSMYDQMTKLEEEQIRQQEERYGSLVNPAQKSAAKQEEEDRLMAELFGSDNKPDSDVDSILTTTRRKNDDLI